MPNTLTAAYVVGLTLRGIKCLRGTKIRVVGGNGSENRKAEVLPPSRLLLLLPAEPFHVQRFRHLICIFQKNSCAWIIAMDQNDLHVLAG